MVTIPKELERSPVTRWVLRNLSTEFALCLDDMEASSGFCRRALQRVLSILQDADLVLRHQLHVEDYGHLPACFTRTYTLAGVRVPNNLLRQNAQPRLVFVSKRAMKLRDEYVQREKELRRARQYTKKERRKDRVRVQSVSAACRAEWQRQADRNDTEHAV